MVEQQLDQTSPSITPPLPLASAEIRSLEDFRQKEAASFCRSWNLDRLNRTAAYFLSCLESLNRPDNEFRDWIINLNSFLDQFPQLASTIDPKLNPAAKAQELQRWASRITYLQPDELSQITWAERETEKKARAKAETKIKKRTKTKAKPTPTVHSYSSYPYIDSLFETALVMQQTKGKTDTQSQKTRLEAFQNLVFGARNYHQEKPFLAREEYPLLPKDNYPKFAGDVIK